MPNIYEIDNTQKDRLLTMLSEYLNFSSSAKFVENGLIQNSGNKVHWFQVTVQLADAMFLKEGQKWNYHHDRFFIRALSLKSIHPIDYLYENHILISNGQPLTVKDSFLSSVSGEENLNVNNTNTNGKTEAQIKEEKKLARKARKEKRLAKKAALQKI